MKKANSGKIYNRSSGRSIHTSAYAYRFKQRIAFAALFLAFIMLLSMVLQQNASTVRESFAAGDIMPYAGETVNANIASLNFDNNDTNTGGRLRNSFNNGITATLKGNSTNRIYYSVYGDYAFYPDHNRDKGYLTLANSDGSGGILDGLTELSVEMVFRTYASGGPYYLFYAAPSDSSSGAHVSIYVQGSGLTAEMVDAEGHTSTCTFTARRNGNGGAVDFSTVGERTFKFTFSNNGTITVYIDGTERTANVSRTGSGTISSLASCVINSNKPTDGIVWIARRPGDNNAAQGFNGYIDDIVITGKQPDPGSSTPDPDPPVPPTGSDHENEDWTKAMHFIVRHWHSVKDSNTSYQDGTGYDEAAGRFFVVGEGYIVPYYNGYRFYMIDQSKTGDDRYTRIKSKTGTDTGDVDNPYIDKIDASEGVIEFVESTVTDSNGKKLDEFSGFAVSAGHAAVASVANTDNPNRDAKLTITYDEKIHLVKTHFFYIDINTNVKNQDLFNGTSRTEIDTAYVYVFTRDYPQQIGGKNYMIGDLVEYSNGTSYVPLYYKYGLPKDLTDHSLPEGLAGYIQLIKVYNTSEGLHTDKTASVAQEYTDGRTFNLDLEAWYSGMSPVDVGLILDSSGSMAFASEDLRPINIYNMGLTPDQIQTLYSKRTKRNGWTWENSFLTDAETAYLLDSHYTDNSRLGETDYNYYVFDGRSSVMEYVPLAYWDGTVSPDPNTKTNLENALTSWNNIKNTLKRSFNFDDSSDRLLDNVSKGHAWYAAKSSTYPSWSGISTKVSNTENSDAIAIDSSGAYVLTGGSASKNAIMSGEKYGFNITVSFTLNATGGTDFGNGKGQKDILYVGQESGSGFPADYGYIRLYLGGDGAFYVDTENAKGYRIGSAFSKRNESHKITVTFDSSASNSPTSVKVYSDDTSVGGFTIKRMQNGTADSRPNRVVFNGFSGVSYTGPNLTIDDIEIYESTLTFDQVKMIYSSDPFAGITGGNSIAYAANHVIGTVGATHLTIDANFNIKGDAGWYYVNHTSKWNEIYYNAAIQTAKVFCAPQKGALFDKNNPASIGYFTDRIIVPATDRTGAANNDTLGEYTPDASSTTKFFIDSAGYLRCFFYTTSDDDAWSSSYVYYCDDSQYIKAEALQRALGFFTTKLREKSEHTLVSATRFSTNDIPSTEYDKLVMLDWTNDNSQIQSIMSLERGTGSSSREGGTRENDRSAYGVNQYNYGLTGQTSTKTGLQSFLDNLAKDNQAIRNDGHKKYLIIFTDGRDTDITYTINGNTVTIANNDAKGIADTLKGPGYNYTIFCVMLTGGPITSGSDEFKAAKAFLETLASSPNYVFTTEDADLDSSASAQSKVDLLTQIFTEKILAIMMDELDGYTVQDYIDPRFDLVDASGYTWYLNAGGNVIVKDRKGQTNATYNLAAGQPVRIHLSSDEDLADGTQWADLYYDSSANMYYLKWVNQTIPNGAVGITEVDPWHGRVTIRAKDDFLGGNDVLSNGNAADQNWVYNPDSEDTGEYANSSGIDDTKREKDDNGNMTDVNKDVSKGFPRTTVNVMPPIGDVEDNQIIYEGENLFAREIADKILELFKTGQIIIPDDAEDGDQDDQGGEGEQGDLDSNVDPDELAYQEELLNYWKYLRSRYYWEYLCRYAKANPDGLLPKYEGLTDEQAFEKRLEDLVERILAAGEDGYEINYYYLDDDYPDNVKTTQTGEKHTSDCLGTLKYTWTENVGHKAGDEDYNEYKYPNGPTTDTNTRKSTLSVSYDPKTADERWGDWLASDNHGADDEYDGRNGDNAKLVTETKPTKQGAYKWDRDYKSEVGDPADWERFDEENKPVESPFTSTGTYTTEIVSGEIILQMVVSEQVKKTLGDGTITYTANLVREYKGQTSTVGIYEVTYTGDSSSGVSIVTAKITLSNDYAAYVAKYGLPIGTYTLVEDSANTDSGSPLIKFKSLYNIDITLEKNRDLWTLFTGQLLPGESDAVDQIQTDKEKEAEAGKYASPTNGTNTAYHGTQTNRPGTGGHLDDLYALFRIELETVGAIKVVKYAQPAADDVQFGFTVTLKPPAGAEENPNTFTVIDQNGETDLEWRWDAQEKIWTAEFSLKDSGWIEIIDLPADWEYTVYETNQRTDKFYNLETVETTDQGASLDLSNGGGSGRTVLGEELEWIFTNVVRLYDMPSVGAALPLLWIFRFLGTALLMAAACMIFYKKRDDQAA